MGGIFISLSAWAQTDVTSTYIKNASFDNGETFAQKKANAVGSSITDWTVVEGGNYQYYTVGASGSSTPDNDSGFGKTVTASDGNKYLHIRHGWKNSTTAIEQTLSNLPVGEYVLSVDYKGGTPRSQSPKLTMKATPATGSIGGIAYSAFPTSLTRDNSTWTWDNDYSDWSTLSYTFYVTATGDVTIYIGFTDSNVQNSSNDELLLDNVRLTYKNYTATLQSALDRANLLYTRTNDSDLNSAITEAQSVLDGATNATSYQSTIDSEVTTLRTAISTAYGKVSFASGEDITFLLENASFESSDELPANVTTAISDITATVNYASMQPVEGWTINSIESNIASGVFAYGSSSGINGYAPSSVSAPITGHTKAIGMIAGWGAKVQYKQDVTLPAGRYSISVPVYNNGGATAFTKNLIGFIENGGTEHLATTSAYTVGSWTTTTIEFDLNAETHGYMSVGYTSVSNQGSGNMPRLYVDGFTITYTDAENAYNATVSSATATYNDAAYANVTGNEKTVLNNILHPATAPSTVAEYFTAIDDINAAVATFTAAKANYDQYAEAAAVATTISATSVTIPTTSAEALTRANELNVNIDTKVTNTYTYNVTDTYVGDWAKTEMGETSGQHWSGDNRTYMDAWKASGNSTATQTFSLPAGEFILKVAGRGQADVTTVTITADGQTVTFMPKGDTGKGIDKTGAANFADADDTYCNNNNGRGWEWRYIPLTLASAKDITVTLSIVRTAGSWASFSDFAILMNSTDADSDDYTALNTAITDAEDYTLGFENGQYAPYNNVDALTKLATAKAIDQGTTNAKGVVTGATTALSNATWTANDGFVQPIYNGMYATVAEGQNYPNGWTRTNGWGNMQSGIEGSYSTAYYNQPGSLQYGNQGVYTMPLAASQLYKLTFAYRSHENNSNNKVTVYVKNGEEGIDAVVFPKNGSTSDWKVVDAYFTTTTAGNYVLTLANDGNTWMTGVSLVKAEESDLALGAMPTNYTYYQTVSLDRTFSDSKWNTLCAPFAFPKNAFAEVKVLSSVTDNGGDINMTFADAETTVAAGTPCLVKAASADATLSVNNVTVDPATPADEKVVDNVTFVGTFAEVGLTQAANSNAWVVSNNNLYNVDSNVTVGAYRAYFTVAAGGGVKSLSFNFDDADGINSIDNGQLTMDNAAIYNLAGQRLNKAQKGVNIINGKKVFIK